MPPKSKKRPRSAEHAALGKAIRKLRTRSGKTQEQLVGAGSQVARLGELERGLSNPTFDTLRFLAEALDVPLSKVITQWERELKESENE